ncbi:MAG: zinc ribbon domain-containing protein [Chloroflexi bacterium]|nr:zinc ribbon domain-containing protein [Chloroflexota bacterium]
MPLYEYRCVDCGAAFEKLSSYSTVADPVTCPSCNGENARRLLSLVARVNRSTGADTGVSTAERCPASNGAGYGCASCGCGHLTH